MVVGSRAGDLAFTAFTASLGVATIYLTATFSVNLYRGLAWHNAQSKMNKQGTREHLHDLNFCYHLKSLHV